MIKIIKKDGTLEDYNEQKIINAVAKAANRGMVRLKEADYTAICKEVWDCLMENEIYETPAGISEDKKIEVYDMHNIVEAVLDELYPKVAKSYREYRNYKKDFVHLLDDVYQYAQQIMYIGDKSNANTDSALVATKRSLIYNRLSTELYKKFFLTVDEKQAMNDGYIYIHDKGARKDTFNCCLADIGAVMRGGFEMGNLWYNEPKSLPVAFDVMGDLILNTASQQYGGFTVPEVDSILSYYAEKSYNAHKQDYKREFSGKCEKEADAWAMKKVEREFEQGYQGLEMKLNSVGSSRGDYPFVAISFGLATDRFGKMASKTILRVHMNGQGKDGFKKPTLFPKLVFLYDKDLHGDGSPEYPNGDVFLAGIACSAKTMYPDWLSLTGEGYVSEMYKKYKTPISPMGCVAGEEVVTYKYKGLLYVESIQKMWKRVAKDYTPLTQIQGQQHQYIPLSTENIPLYIYDTKIGGFVRVTNLNKNYDSSFVDVYLSRGRRLECTPDHPLEIEGYGVKQAVDLQPGDKVLINSGQYNEESQHCDEIKAWLEGYIMCLGSKCAEGMLAVYLPNTKGITESHLIQTKNKLHQAIAQVLGCTPIESVINNRFAYVLMGSDKIKLLAQYGALHKRNRAIPGKVFKYQESAKIAFLQGILDSEGWAKTTDNTTYRLTFKSKEMAIQTTLLARAIGYQSDLFYQHYTVQDNIDDTRLKYRVQIYFKDKQCLAGYTEAEVKGVYAVSRVGCSYDVTTASEHFEVSGIYSHNCRAFLSPWFERGGMHPADNEDTPVFTGRCNLGVVSLHLPMILAKSRQESRDFYEVLDYYLELIRNLHKRTFEYLAEMKASTNPVMFCEGGLYGGHLQPNDTIRPLLRAMTMSYGITALNELQQLYNGKSLVEDGDFALEVMEYINNKVEQYKHEDNILYAIYGTPAETLCLDGDTLVHTQGNTLTKIKDLKIGDMVLSYDLASNTREYKEVLNAQKTGIHKEVLKIEFSNGREIICTPNHQLAYLHMTVRGLMAYQEMQYAPARLLHKDTRVPYLVCNEDGTYKQTITKVVSVEPVPNRDVYDIEVADNHNFFVGDKTAGLLVHNCGTQVEQFRKMYGIVKNVSDRTYVSNSFHCQVSEKISPIVKQDKERRFWDMFNGGKIQYVRYPLGYNTAAIKALVLRAMDLGFYEGVNLSLSYCEDCGYEQVDMDTCPECGSTHITKVDRMNGYLSYTRVKGETRYNKAKNDEIRDRVSM